jgi:hypothetical protein
MGADRHQTGQGKGQQEMDCATYDHGAPPMTWVDATDARGARSAISWVARGGPRVSGHRRFTLVTFTRSRVSQCAA